jgi:hypothetical protein
LFGKKIEIRPPKAVRKRNPKENGEGGQAGSENSACPLFSKCKKKLINNTQNKSKTGKC